jgi:putative ABC transport system substrate-binding protein
VADGLVASLSQPGANATGVSLMNFLLETKRFELLREVAPNASAFAVLLNPTSPVVESRTQELQEAAQAAGQPLAIFHASTDAELDAAFAELADAEADGLVVGSSPFFASRRERIVGLAAGLRMPAIYEWREFAEAGGLMSYGASLADAYRLVGVYAGRILAGARPADLPVVQPSRFEFVINLNTAVALGIEIPPMLLARADEVIE